MANGREQRRSFRIAESVCLKYDVISDREFEQGLDRRKMRLGSTAGVRSKILDLDARLGEKLYLLRNESAHAADCIDLLNDKLTAVIEHLPELRESKAALVSQPAQQCELGASGMVFGTSEEFSPGTKLSLRFLLASDNRYVETFCQVVRNVDPPEEDDPKPYGVAVEFHGMNSGQKEMLIQHLFNRESETLRMRRLKIEAAS